MFKLDHIGIASRDMSKLQLLLRDLFKIEFDQSIRVADQNVMVSFSKNSSDTKIELIQPTSDEHPKMKMLPHPLKRFLEDKADGLHHICLAVSDIDSALQELKKNGVRTLSGISIGAEGHKVAFLDIKKTHGILIELVEK